MFQNNYNRFGSIFGYFRRWTYAYTYEFLYDMQRNVEPLEVVCIADGKLYSSGKHLNEKDRALIKIPVVRKITFFSFKYTVPYTQHMLPLFC